VRYEVSHPSRKEVKIQFLYFLDEMGNPETNGKKHFQK
jgi:hypothetical protein